MNSIFRQKGKRVVFTVARDNETEEVLVTAEEYDEKNQPVERTGKLVQSSYSAMVQLFSGIMRSEKTDCETCSLMKRFLREEERQGATGEESTGGSHVPV